MTLLSICQDAADEIGIQRPDAVIGSQDPEVQKLLRLANKGGKFLAKLAYWRAMTKSRSFTGISGEEQTGILPSDFDRMVPETFWNQSQARLITEVDEIQWQSMEAVGYTGSEFYFLYRGTSIFITPSVQGDTLAFSYVTPHWCQSSGGTGQAAWAADTDTGVLSEELLTYDLVFRYKYAEGQPSDEDKRQYQQEVNTYLKNDKPKAGVMLAADIFGPGRRFSGAPWPDGAWIGNWWY